jgi:hypothetical protein
MESDGQEFCRSVCWFRGSALSLVKASAPPNRPNLSADLIVSITEWMLLCGMKMNRSCTDFNVLRSVYITQQTMKRKIVVRQQLKRGCERGPVRGDPG